MYFLYFALILMNLNSASYRLLRESIQWKKRCAYLDSCTTNTILREVNFFQTLTKREGQVLTIAGRDAMIVGSGRATFHTSNGYSNSYRGGITVSRFNTYPTML